MSGNELPKHFDHNGAEARIYRNWEENGVFDAKVDKTKPAFCVVIPPPNVTGILHMGHVLDNTPQDVMTRWHRMRGFSAVWIPGTDHAGIATQNVVKRQLLAQGIKPEELGREKFLEKVWQWKEKHGDLIVSQLKRLGCSCDWKRERFTMDEGLSRAVLEAFIAYYKKGLIYRGKRMINWCTVCGTALANDEVEHEDRKSSLWHLKYPVVDEAGEKTGEYVVVATTRPETMLGDTAVAYHPDDERYKDKLKGKRVLLPLQNRVIPLVADDFVDQAFGSGLVKITPGHDPNDYQVGIRHKLELVVVIGLNGVMSAEAGEAYVGLDRFEARKKVVEDLESKELVEKIEPHKNSVGTCYRCNSVIEPMVSDQWFVKMKPLAEKAKQAVLNGEINIVPDSEKHDYFHWMDTIEDWCISRQLWWGHRIPVYYCDSCNSEVASIEEPSSCDKCGAQSLRQDEDVLDTWFSSQLWPFSTLGWPEKTEELDYWYPNNWLMSGRDILFFWDARMIMSGLELLGKPPFRTLALHGLVRDAQGRKLSKSLNNSPDPLELFDTYGTDAVRASILLNYPLGRQDTRLGKDFYQRGQALVTKLWNSARLILSIINEGAVKLNQTLEPKSIEDAWVLSKLASLIATHDEYLNRSDFSHALRSLSDFFWNDYCDWYLEMIKGRLRSESPEERSNVVSVSCHIFSKLLSLFHPHIPFVTEELWSLFRSGLGIKGEAQGLFGNSILARSEWPKSDEFSKDRAAEEGIGLLIDITRAVRDFRQTLNLSPRESLELEVLLSKDKQVVLDRVRAKLLSMANVSLAACISDKPEGSDSAPVRFSDGVAYVRLPAEVDKKSLAGVVTNKIQKLEKQLAGVRAQLANQDFVNNAPEGLVLDTKEKQQSLEFAIEQLGDYRKVCE